MEARATYGGSQIAGGALRTFIVAVVIALLVGGAGGYVVRALTSSVSAAQTTDIQRPFVVEKAPYSSTGAPQQCGMAGTPPSQAC